MTHYPIDDVMFGLSDEQKQLRETVFNFCQKELAPKAYQIDKDNNFPEMRYKLIMILKKYRFKLSFCLETFGER